MTSLVSQFLLFLLFGFFSEEKAWDFIEYVQKLQVGS